MLDAPDDLQPLYRTMLALGGAAVLILALGLGVFLRFAPPGQGSGLHARVIGVFAYDAGQGRVVGEPAVRFRRDQPFAAKVDWTSLPPDVVVSGRWYNSVQEEVGATPPERAADLARDGTLVPVRTPPGLRANLPGPYTLVVVRYSQGRPVELLASKGVQVERDP